ncbi:hypothetical protein FXO37_10091 [Capsicum annuum]|nr:hypothetical protein FXO37_10091 [Capsicum annuum]
MSKDTVSIALRRNGSYADIVKSVMENGELSCYQSEVVISYLMKRRGKIHPTLIRNDKHVELYMVCIDSDNSRPILRVKVIGRSQASTSAPSPPLTADGMSTKYDCMGGDEWDNNEDYKEEECGGGEDRQFGPQGSHSFSDGVNHYVGQTFKDKNVYVILSKKRLKKY